MAAEWYLIASLRDHNKFCGGRNPQSNPVFESQTTQMIKKNHIQETKFCFCKLYN